MKNITVSILIPVFNREEYIGETIESALNQTYSDTEIVIVDNASTDKTWDIIQNYAKNNCKIRAFQNPTNVGPVLNWKRCIEEAKGVYGKILWSDDLIRPTFIEKTIPYLANREDIGFVFTAVKIFNKDNLIKKSYNIGESGIYPSKRYTHGILLLDGEFPVSPGCALFRLKDLRKNLILRIPHKDYGCLYKHAIGPDLLLFLIAANDYPFFAFVNDFLSLFRVHDTSITVRTNRANLVLTYRLAMAYYLETYAREKTYLFRKFNTILLLYCIKYRREDIFFKKISYFYSITNYHKINYTFLINIIVKTGYLKYKHIVRVIKIIISKYFR